MNLISTAIVIEKYLVYVININDLAKNKCGYIFNIYVIFQ